MEVDVTLILGIDGESERVFRVAREAARMLKENYGVWAYLIPISVWSHGAIHVILEPWIHSDETMIPRVYVNGHLVPPSMLRTPEDLADHVISLLRSHMESGDYLLSGLSSTPRSPEAIHV